MHLAINIWPFSDSSNLKAVFSQVQILKSVSLIALSLFMSSVAGLCFQGLFFVCKSTTWTKEMKEPHALSSPTSYSFVFPFFLSSWSVFWPVCPCYHTRFKHYFFLPKAIVCNSSDPNSECFKNCDLLPRSRHRRALPYSAPVHTTLLSHGPIWLTNFDKIEGMV